MCLGDRFTALPSNPSFHRSPIMADDALSGMPASPPNAPSPALAALQNVWRFILKQRTLSVAVIAIAMIAYFQFSKSVFLSAGNLQTLAQYTATTAIISAGEVMLLICGEIDLSVGSVFAMAPFIMYFAYQDGVPLIGGILLGLLAGAVVGFINGFASVYLKVPSLIATLGTQFLVTGVTLIWTNATPVITPETFPKASTFALVFGNSPYWEIAWAVIIVLVMQVLLSLTPWGLRTVATGGNPLGASEVGIGTNRIKMLHFIVASMLAAFAGTLLAFQLTSTDPLAGGTVIMFNAVAGAVIGGTALNGGSGTVIGALLGTFVLGVLQDGINIIGVNADYYYIVIGAAILAAMIFNVRLQLLRKAGRS
jgi:simple sugar transport system permease protein